MIESRKFVIAAILLGLGLIIAGLLLAPFNGAKAAASRATDDVAAERIGAAFASISPTTADPAVAAAVASAAKGDLGAPADCAGATWPNIAAACLQTADGRPAPHVRTVTVGYQSDASTTVLVRLPATEVASR